MMTTKFIDIDGDVVNIDHVVFVGSSYGVYAGVLSLSNGVKRNILDKVTLDRVKRELLLVEPEQKGHA
jgi:hypothetical protein